MHCHFALGNIFHDSERFDEAFGHYRKGNTLKRNTISYESGSFTAHVDRLIDVYSRDYFNSVSGAESDSELPVFIVGMPRSGTSLVEQIVSSHPQVFGAGELVAFGRFEQELAEQFGAASPYPECMPACRESVSGVFSKRYLEELHGYAAGAERVTDKMPDNFMRVGLIRTLFPRARIIHCQRSALDTCTSNYLNYFAAGNEYSFDLSELGRYYLDYERLMAHWISLFPAEILEVSYEELVENQEQTSRRLIRHIGLEWDDRCLDFHKTERAVNPFSSMQVRQPLYTGSIGRWRHYEKHLAPLLEVLPAAAAKVPDRE